VCSEEDLVIVAARKNRRHMPGVCRDDRTCGGGQRHLGSLDNRSELRRFAEVPQVSEQAIRDIKRCVCNADQPRTKRDARPRQAISIEEKACGVRIEVRQLATQSQKAKCAIADGAGHEHPISGTRPASTKHPPRRDVAERHDRNCHRAWRRIGVTADQMHAAFGLILGEAPGKGGNPVFGDRLRLGNMMSSM
jgi:hypothetical protein